MALLAGATAALPHTVFAQPAGRKYTVGVFTAGTSEDQAQFRAILIEALRELGWIEGKNIEYEWRAVDDRPDRLAELATELVRLKVDAIVAAGTVAPLAAKQATSTIPIIMAPAGDPIGTGLVASLAHPGGNVTGLSLMAPDLGGKRLEILKEILPMLSRAAVLWNSATPYPGFVVKAMQEASGPLGIQLQSIEAREPQDLEPALASAMQERSEALVVVEDPLTFSYRKQIVDFASTNRLPTMLGLRAFAHEGGLVVYGANINDLWRRSAGYVDKILRGAKPADLPVEQPTKFGLVINLRTAKALGLTIPSSILARADEVIE